MYAGVLADGKCMTENNEWFVNFLRKCTKNPNSKWNRNWFTGRNFKIFEYNSTLSSCSGNFETQFPVLDKINVKSLHIAPLNFFLVILYKSLFFNSYPRFLSNMLTQRSTTYSLPGSYVVSSWSENNNLRPAFLFISSC